MTTEQPLALKLADELEIIYGSLNTPHECAAELRRQHAEIAMLRETLKEAGLFLHHAWCDVQMNEYSFEKLNKTMEVVDAALAQGEKT
jgi:nicotinamide mononucleotide adenylyltransferase